LINFFIIINQKEGYLQILENTKEIYKYNYYIKSAKPGILFSAFCRSSERTLWNEGRVGES